MRSLIPGSMAEEVGAHVGSSAQECDRCHSSTPGDRWEWISVKQGRTHAPARWKRGVIDEACVDDINK